LQRITINSNTTLGLTSLISTGIALWSANAGIKGLFEAINVAFGEHEKRSLIRLNVVTLTFTITALASMVAFMAIMIVLPQALAYLWLSESAKWLIKGLAFAGMFAMFAAGVAATYRWGPSRNEASWKWITPGTLLAVVVAAIVSVLFSWYVSNFGSYNATYGSLGAVIGFVTWIWILMIILIVGAELNAETEQQTAADTTVAPNEPPGERGAHAADTSENPALEVSPKWRRKQPLHSEKPHKAGGRISIGQLAVALPAAALLYWYGKKQAAKIARDEHT
jgi:membrane protein